MAWTKNPVIRDLEPYAKKHGYAFVVVYAVHNNGQTFTVNSYGQNRQLCAAAAFGGILWLIWLLFTWIIGEVGI